MISIEAETVETTPDAPARGREFWRGVAGVAPLLVGVIPFGLIYGVLAISIGLPTAAAQGMSSVIFAGSAQFITTQLLRDGASRFLQDSVSTGPEEPWCGWRPMTIDGMPIIDRSPRFENAWIAAGHNMLGLSMAPATGRLVAEMISGDAPHLPIKPYSATRFGWIA